MLIAFGITPLQVYGGRPEFEVLRYEEDWSRFDHSASEYFGENFKNIPLDAGDTSTLTLGGQFQALYELTRHGEWGEAPEQHEGVLYDRYLFHGDLRLGRRLRFFGEAISGFSHGESGRPGGDSEDRLGLQNLFVDFLWLPAESSELALRLGRQQLAFGSGRLVNERNGANIPRTFDGARLIFSDANSRVDGFATYIAEENTGSLDDGTNQDVALWGLYSVHALSSDATLDLYYLGFRDRAAVFDQGSGHEIRYSVGVRAANEGERWDYEVELTGQVGKFAGADIRAWAATIIGGHTWRDRRWSPRLAIASGLASGDDDPEDPELQTFNALFPPDDHFSELGLLGHANFINLQPSLFLKPGEGFTLSFDVNFYWRYSRHDGVYSPPRELIRSGAGSNARHVATAASVIAEWTIDRNLPLLFNYTRSVPGKFIRETGDDKAIDFVVLQLGFIF